MEFDDKKGNYVVKGVYNKIDDDTIEITELPIGIWTQSYKEVLEGMLQGTEKNPAVVKVFIFRLRYLLLINQY